MTGTLSGWVQAELKHFRLSYLGLDLPSQDTANPQACCSPYCGKVMQQALGFCRLYAQHAEGWIDVSTWVCSTKATPKRLLQSELTTKRWSRPLAAAGFRTCRTSANMIACHTVVLSPQIHHSHRNICRAGTQRGQKGHWWACRSRGRLIQHMVYADTQAAEIARVMVCLKLVPSCQTAGPASPCHRRAQLAAEHSCTGQTGAACSGPELLRGRLSQLQS